MGNTGSGGSQDCCEAKGQTVSDPSIVQRRCMGIKDGVQWGITSQ